MTENQANAICDRENKVAPAMKTKARTLSADMNAITSKWDGKGEAPVPEAKMGTLALFVAWMKEFPSKTILVDFHLDNNFNTTNTKCAHTRSIIPFGGPLEGYKNTEDREDEQQAKVKKYILDNLEGDFAKAAKGGYSDYLTVNYFMTNLIFDIFIQILLNDAIRAILSISLVVTYIWITTGSGFLAAVGMSEIVLSLPVAWCFVRVIFQVRYFAGLNMMCLFIVCAIGADDIFVFMDAYVQVLLLVLVGVPVCCCLAVSVCTSSILARGLCCSLAPISV